MQRWYLATVFDVSKRRHTLPISRRYGKAKYLVFQVRTKIAAFVKRWIKLNYRLICSSKSTGQDDLEHRVKRMEDMLANLTRNLHTRTMSPPAESSSVSLSSFPHSCQRQSKLPKQREEPMADLSQQMQALSLVDYEKTLYVGQSSALHYVDEDLFTGNEKEGLAWEEKWIIHKLNEEEDEQMLIKSKEIQASSTNIRRFPEFDDIPNMTQELADAMLQV